jgi:hypothetical protein
MGQVLTAPALGESVSAWAGEDVGNIIALEHVNTCITDQALATTFYVLGLGFTRDPYLNVGLDNMWINVGEQQIHMPTRAQAQVLPGHVGVVVPDLDQLVGRLKSIEGALAGTQFGFSVESDHVAATSPYGNRFKCHAPAPRFGPIRVGIPYLEVLVRAGAAEGLARFYEQVFQTPATVERDGLGAATHVEIGTYQRLTYRETSEEIRPYDNHHIAIYLANFSGPYERLRARKLLKAEAANHQFRVQELVDPDTGEHLATLEHEVRSLYHPMWGRVFVNRNAEQSMRAFTKGQDAFNPYGA